MPDELGEVKRIDEDLGYLLVQMLDKEPKLRVIIQQVLDDLKCLLKC